MAERRELTVADVRPGGAFRLEADGRLVPTSKRSAGGALAHANGQAGEDLVGANHQRCLAESVAYIRKCDPSFHPLGVLEASDVKGTVARMRALVGKMFGYFSNRAGVDYLGWTIPPAGEAARPIVAEAKSTEGGYVHLARVEPAQREELELAHGRCIAALLVVHDGALYAVPWADVRTRASVHARDLARYRVGPDECWPARWGSR